jgi:hypothetical protein
MGRRIDLIEDMADQLGNSIHARACGVMERVGVLAALEEVPGSDAVRVEYVKLLENDQRELAAGVALMGELMRELRQQVEVGG